MASLPLDRNMPESAERERASDAGTDGFSVADWCATDGLPSASEWAHLADAAAEPNPFYEQWFLRPALDALGQDCQIAQLRDQGRLVGLLPVSRSAGYYGYPVPHLRGWLHDNAFCGVPLIAQGYEDRFWHELLHWADSHAGKALFFHFEHMPASGAVFDALDRVLREAARPGAVVHRRERAILRSDSSPEDYFARAMSSKKRKELRRQAKRLGELGELTFTRSDGRRNAAAWAKQFLELEQAGWKGQEGTALACDGRTAALFRDSLTGAAEAGRLEILDLSLDGRPIAMLANLLTPPGSFAFKTTFDENHARYSPGVLLQRENLDLLAREGIEWCDSCAAADHPMIERIWRDKREVVRVSIAIGGKARRALYTPILRREAGHIGPGLVR